MKRASHPKGHRCPTSAPSLNPAPTDGNIAWFTHDRFGLFIHGLLYALPARHEWVKSYERRSTEDYEIYFRHFDPNLYSPTNNRLYAHVFAWPFVELFLNGLAPERIDYAQLLHDASEVRIQPRPEWQGGSELRPNTPTLRLPVKKPDVTVPVIEIFLR